MAGSGNRRGLESVGHIEFMLAIECEARRDRHGRHQRPALPDHAAAGQLLAHVTSDLGDLLPHSSRCCTTLAAALFDQSQVLRPGFPVYAALRTVSGSPDKPGTPEQRHFAISASEGAMPHPDLQPSNRLSPGTLQILPLLLRGEPTDIAPLAAAMEEEFLAKGRVSPHTAKALEAAFRTGVLHARFMTLADLLAMFQSQLQHFGFAPLWELLDAALDERPEPLDVTGRCGQQFHWDGRRVHGRFETFDFWAGQGSGRELAGDPNRLAQRYAAWTREYRQYLLTLKAHRVPLAQHLAGQDGEELDASFLIEEAPLSARGQLAAVTEHSSGELGTIAVTVVSRGRQLNFYPLTPEGLNEMHAHIREAGYITGSVAYPGSIRHDPGNRRLTPERLQPPA